MKNDCQKYSKMIEKAIKRVLEERIHQFDVEKEKVFNE